MGFIQNPMAPPCAQATRKRAPSPLAARGGSPKRTHLVWADRRYVVCYVVYRYTNVAAGSAERGFTYTGKTLDEERRHRQHEAGRSTNVHMKAARERGDRFEYRILERLEWACRATDFDDEQPRLEAFLRRVAQCEAGHTPALWPRGSYNIRDESNVGEHYRAAMLAAAREVHDRRWDRVIQPALQAYFDEHQELWSVPQDHPAIGSVVKTMRSQGCYIRESNPKAAARRAWLEERKWADSHDDGKWTHVIQPALQAYFDEHQELWSVPQDHPVIGSVVDHMRSHGAYIGESNPKAAARRAWLEERKWADSHNDGRWTYVIQPAFRAFFAHHKHLLVRQSGDYADAADWWPAALMPLKELGRLVNSIRSGNTAIPPEFRDELVDTMGFVFHTKDLKTHLLRASAHLWAARVVERTLGLFAVLPTLWGKKRDAKLRALIPELAHWAKSASMWAAGAAAWHARRAAVIASTCGKRGPRFLAALAEKSL